MKTVIRNTVALLLVVFVGQVSAQKTDKKVVNFTVERTIDMPASKVWHVVGEDFGAIANSHPKIVSSEFNQGHMTGGENVSRTCNFNEKGTKYLQETQINFDAENYTFKVLINHASGVPLNTDYSYGVYKVEPIDENSCKLSMEMNVRTKPAFMGGMAKKQFMGDIADYLLAVEHHVKTGENVNQDNFKAIKKQYKK